MRRRGRGNIVRAGDLFEVYKKRLRAPQGTIVAAFTEVVEDVLGAKLPRKSIAYTVATRMLRVIAPGPLKSEILLRKEEILTHLKGRLGAESAPKDIL